MTDENGHFFFNFYHFTISIIIYILAHTKKSCLQKKTDPASCCVDSLNHSPNPLELRFFRINPRPQLCRIFSPISGGCYHLHICILEDWQIYISFLGPPQQLTTAWWLKAREIHPHTVLEARSRGPGSRGCAPSRGSAEDPGPEDPRTRPCFFSFWWPLPVASLWLHRCNLSLCLPRASFLCL